MPQTLESISILKQYKTPFVVAANKIDRISGWTAHKDSSFFASYENQRADVKEDLDMKIYKLIGELHGADVTAERFDQMSDYTRSVAIIPVSAKTGEGVAELLTILTGLTQRYL